MALVDRGDYALNEQLDVEAASKYYIMANQLNDTPMAFDNPTKRAIARRIVYLLNSIGDYEAAINLGEHLVIAATRNGISEISLWYVSDLLQSYIGAGMMEEAKELMNRYYDKAAEFPEAANKIKLQYSSYLVASDDDNEAVRVLIDLLATPDLRRDTKMWAERFLAKAYSKLGDRRMVLASDRMNATTKNQVVSQMLAISPRKRRNWLQYCEEAISYQLELPDNPRALYNAADLNLFKKSLLFRTSSQIENFIESIPEAIGEMKNLKSLRQQLQSAITKGDSISTPFLRHEIDEKEQRIVNLYLNADTLLQQVDVGIEQVCNQLSDDGVAVDFLWYSRHDHIKIGAFLFNNKIDFTYLPLLECDNELPPDASVEIWSKLMPLLEGYEKVYFCTDGSLNNLPLEYAVLPDGRHVDDVFRLHRVFHLSQINGPLATGENIVFVGVSDHNSPYQEVSADRGNWTDLPNVIEELNAIRQNISDSYLTVYLNDSSTEENVKQLDNTMITTLHLSTHGVFRGENALNEAADSIGSDDYHIAKRMAAVGNESISALILRRGNLYWRSPVTGDGEDDLLTAEEIELMSFPNLNLTVLSACDTGLGHIDPEGVWGLQRAFRIAGTKSLICALNKVDDYWTAQFMDAFYQQAARGETIYDAFHSAQRWLRNELPDEPEIWSSFILIE